VPHQLEPELEAALQNLWLLELDQEALSDKEKRLQQAPQLPDPALQEQTVEECGNSTLMIHQELKLAQFLFWLCRCCSLHQSSCCTSGENTHALKWIINEGPCWCWKKFIWQCHHSTVRIYCQKKEIYNFSSYNHLTGNWEDGMSNERKVNKCDKLFNLYFQI